MLGAHAQRRLLSRFERNPRQRRPFVPALARPNAADGYHRAVPRSPSLRPRRIRLQPHGFTRGPPPTSTANSAIWATGCPRPSRSRFVFSSMAKTPGSITRVTAANSARILPPHQRRFRLPRAHGHGNHCRLGRLGDYGRHFSGVMDQCQFRCVDRTRRRMSPRGICSGMPVRRMVMRWSRPSPGGQTRRRLKRLQGSGVSSGG